MVGCAEAAVVEVRGGVFGGGEEEDERVWGWKNSGDGGRVVFCGVRVECL